MSWSAEELILVVTGALFLVVVGLSFMPRLAVSVTSRVFFAMGALATGGLAPALAMIGTVKYPPLVWLFPLVPLVILGALLRDVGRGAPQPSDVHTSRLSHPGDADAPRRAAFFPPMDHTVSIGEGGDGRAREMASDPQATTQELADIAFSHPHLRATVAANPAASANVLEWLASHNDAVVNAAIAARSAEESRSPVAQRA